MKEKKELKPYDYLQAPAITILGKCEDNEWKQKVANLFICYFEALDVKLKKDNLEIKLM